MCFIEVSACKASLELLLLHPRSSADAAPPPGLPLAAPSAAPRQNPAQVLGLAPLSRPDASAYASSDRPAAVDHPVHRHLQAAVNLYQRDAKRWFNSMVRSVMTLHGLGQQLRSYHAVEAEQPHESPSLPSCGPANGSQSVVGPGGGPVAGGVASIGGRSLSSGRSVKCFGCATRFLGMALELLGPLAERHECRQEIVEGQTLEVLVTQVCPQTSNPSSLDPWR